MADVAFVGLMLLAAHWVADYPLQGDFLATAKQNGPLRAYHLIAHAGIHGGAVAIVTGSVGLGIAEWIAHAIIDENKVWSRTSFATDQALHIACKAVWLAILLMMGSI
ncbi:DUF3307 domain-containing protein [Fulvimarina endophytica]|uniref:DUF3307 domain-containing protein n=1 Tax=Fulvimarina endophytica TaxID=2293836 RepID=A0A371XB72_9HYPH|nr:DUF3307 domain-containing protein [Fulvimarina endophytica]RFC66460.1 DUF3307 domain-containing protein [Fulvimarina endophytica]